MKKVTYWRGVRRLYYVPEKEDRIFFKCIWFLTIYATTFLQNKIFFVILLLQTALRPGHG